MWWLVVYLLRNEQVPVSRPKSFDGVHVAAVAVRADVIRGRALNIIRAGPAFVPVIVKVNVALVAAMPPATLHRVKQGDDDEQEKRRYRDQPPKKNLEPCQMMCAHDAVSPFGFSLRPNEAAMNSIGKPVSRASFVIMVRG